MKAKSAILIIICILLLPLSGCKSSGSIYSNYREISELQIIRVLGIDKSEKGVRLTIASGQASGTPVIMSRDALSVEEAMESLQDYASNSELFYAHTQYVIFGRALAEEGIGAYLGFIERSTDIRMGASLFVMRQGTAQALMTGNASEKYDIAKVLSAVERDTEIHGDNHVFSCTDTARALSERGSCLMCALSAQSAKSTVFGTDAGITAVPDGFGIFRDGRLVDFIEPRDAVAACILMGFAGTEAVTVPDGEGGQATLVTDRARAVVKPTWEDAQSISKIDVSIDADFGLVELSRPHALQSDGLRERLSRNLEDTLQTRTRAVLDKVRILRADFLNLSAKLRGDNAPRYDAMRVFWLDEAGADTFQVRAEARILRSFDLNGSVSLDGGDDNAPQ